MSSVLNIYFGKVTKIIDDRSWLVNIDFLSQDSLGETGPAALPFGFISSSIEVDDKIIIFETDQKPGTYFYIPLKNDGQICIKNKETEINITQEENLIIKAKDKTFMDFNGDTNINVKSMLKFNGPGKIKMNGTVIPNNTNPPVFCGIGVCPYTGLPHGNNELTLIDPAEQLPDTSKEKNA